MTKPSHTKNISTIDYKKSVTLQPKISFIPKVKRAESISEWLAADFKAINSKSSKKNNKTNI